MTDSSQPTPAPAGRPADRFHEHLQTCTICRERRHALCDEGYLLLRAALVKQVCSAFAIPPERLK